MFSCICRVIRKWRGYMGMYCGSDVYRRNKKLIFVAKDKEYINDIISSLFTPFKW